MKKGLLALAAVLALSVGALAVVGVGAQEGQDGEGRSFFGRVAEKLGITEDQLNTAVKDSQTDIINEKLAAGEITQEQADRAKERIAEGKFRFPGRGGRHHGGGHWCRIGAKFVDSTATILQVEPSVVADGLQQGKSLAEIAAEHGMSAEDYKAALSAAYKSELDERVASGDITQERADHKLAEFNEYLDRIINHKPDPDNVQKCRERLDNDDEQESPSPAPEGTGA
jgi:uncharacterized membrane protein